MTVRRRTIGRLRDEGNPRSTPTFVTDPSMTGTPLVGAVATLNTGTITNARSVEVEVRRVSNNAVVVPRQAASAVPTLTVAVGLTGDSLVLRVWASNIRGVRSRSAPPFGPIV